MDSPIILFFAIMMALFGAGMAWHQLMLGNWLGALSYVGLILAIVLLILDKFGWLDRKMKGVEE